MTDMTLSPAGLIEIAEHEGIVPAPYRDSVGVWTWGIGHTAAAGGPDPASIPRAMPQDIDAAVIAAIDQFAIDVKGYEARVNAAITVPLAQHQFDALVSFDFNTGGIHRARLTAAINAGESDAARHFMGWLRPPEIRKRRTAEMALFRTGDYAANGDAVPIWRTDGKGRLTGILRTISGAELLRQVAVAPIPADLPRMVDVTPAVAAAARVRAAQEAASHALKDLEAALAA
jgi:lysozyme